MRTRHFDVNALHAAVNARREELSLSWTDVARQVSAYFNGTGARPVSASTISGILRRRVIEGDGVLQMLRWLDKTPESFVIGGVAGKLSDQLPQARAPGILRFDSRAIHAALDARRVENGMSWQQVAAEVGGCTARSLTRLARGGRVVFPHVMRVTGWLGRPASSFTVVKPR